MPNYLVVRTYDVNYAVMDKVTVTVAFDGGTAMPMPPTSEAGTYEVAIPASGHNAKVRITMKGFWEFEQGLVLTQSDPPSIAWENPRELQSRAIEVHDRSGDFNLVYHAVVMQCRDARAKVNAVQQSYASNIIPFAPTSHPIRDFDTAPVLHVGGVGWARLNHTLNNETPDGQLYFVERPEIPKLIGIYVPKDVLDNLTTNGWLPGGAPLHFHVFYHPDPAGFGRDYPYGYYYIELMNRYMLKYPAYNVGKAMVNQHHAAKKKWILVFPVGMAGKWFGTSSRQANLFRLLQEIGHWLQRFVGQGMAMQHPGKVAVSAFSGAAEVLMQMLNSTLPEFENEHLREVYGLDPVLAGSTASGCQRMAAWLKVDEVNRRLRIYTQRDEWRKQLKANLPNLVQTPGPETSLENQSSSATVLYVPKSMWAAIKRDMPPSATGGTSNDDSSGDEGDVHQIIPMLFMQHALKASPLK